MKWATLLTAGLLFAAGTAPAQSPELVRVSRFSGKPVPRFETLKFAAVNGRAGPSKDHPVLWLYERKGLPMLIVKESESWRKVRDPAGAEVWIHARMLESGHKAFVQAATVLHKEPDAASDPVAELQSSLLVDLGDCDAGWCTVDAGAFHGFAAQAALWGSDAGESGL